MKEILLTSSVLILALLLLRLLFRKTISRRVQYALWGLVALRLLVPVSLPAMEHNVLTAAEPVQEPAASVDLAGSVMSATFSKVSSAASAAVPEALRPVPMHRGVAAM